MEYKYLVKQCRKGSAKTALHLQQRITSFLKLQRTHTGTRKITAHNHYTVAQINFLYVTLQITAFNALL